MFPLAAHTFGFVWQEDADIAFEQIASLGIGQVQLMASPPHFDPWIVDRDRNRHLRETIRRHELTLLAADLSSADVNLASPSGDVREFAIETYSRLIENCAALEATGVCVGSGRRNAILDSANFHLMPLFRDAFDVLVERAKSYGLTVLLENHAHGMLASAESIAAFLVDYASEDVRVIYDVANAYAINEEPTGGLALLRSHLQIVHLSDSPKGVWRHDPIGSGTIDFDGVRKTLIEIGFDGPVALEILSATPLESLRQSRDALVAGGWRFDR